MIKHKNKLLIGLILVVVLLIGAIVIYFYFPKLYTNPNSINDFNTCENVGYPITPGTDGGKACTLPNGNVFQSNFG
jgi:hypothetical protein